VDKACLLHSINGLRRRLRAGKSLRLVLTILGQQIRFRKSRLFCTSAPVDIQRLFHKPIQSGIAKPLLVAVITLCWLAVDDVH